MGAVSAVSNAKIQGRSEQLRVCGEAVDMHAVGYQSLKSVGRATLLCSALFLLYSQQRRGCDHQIRSWPIVVVVVVFIYALCSMLYLPCSLLMRGPFSSPAQEVLEGSRVFRFALPALLASAGLAWSGPCAWKRQRGGACTGFQAAARGRNVVR